MKINQRELEFKILKCILTYDNALYMATEKMLDEHHFMSKEPGTDVAITGKLFMLCKEYAEQSGGYKITETVLESILLQKGTPTAWAAKFLNLFYQINDEEASLDELPHFIKLAKNRYVVKLQSEMIEQVADFVNDDRIEESVATITDYVSVMVDEQDDFQKDKVEFNMADAESFFFEEYDNRAANMDLFRGINCGLKQIDDKTFGFMPSQLVVFLAPSSGGKSVQLLNIADHAHRVCKKNVLYFSFEMSSWLCKLRHASLISEVEYSRLKGITITPQERDKVMASFKELQNGKYFEYMEAIEDPTPEFIEQKIREISATKGRPEFIVADYIGNMTTRATSKNAKHWEKNGDAAEGLFKIAKRYGITVLTAQQINRDSIKENRKRKEDGKSGAYYQDAASGDQRLMHLATYVIGMEPNKEEELCWYHPVKMRDAYFIPFAAKWNAEMNKVTELNDFQQAALNVIKTADVNTGYEKPIHHHEEVEADLSDWAGFSDF